MSDDAAPGPLAQTSAPQVPGRPAREDAGTFGSRRPVTVKLILEYDGTDFFGWQLQPRHRSVEGELRAALRQLTGESVAVHGAGRTDAGAHALGQVASFDYAGRLSPDRIRAALNARLPADVSVVSAELARRGFHARFSALGRHYRYRWLDRQARPALLRHHCWHVRRRLDDGAMAEAVLALAGTHDWTAFCSAAEPVRKRTRPVWRAELVRAGDLVDLLISAEGFLRGQIRGVAGALAVIGAGRQDPGWLAALLAGRDRQLAPPAAPARGLTLMQVSYAEAEMGPQRHQFD